MRHPQRLAVLAAVLAVAGVAPAEVATIRIGTRAKLSQEAAKQAPAEADGGDKSDEVTFAACEGGEGVVKFDLGRLPKGAKIHWADLLVRRSKTFDATDEAILVDIEIRPLFRTVAEGAAPKPQGKPLALRPPWYDRFDATEAVRAWAGGKGPPGRDAPRPGDPKTNGGFFVKALPYWHREGTCLEIAYEGSPRKVPPQATGVKAFHRSGQTFITWKEIEDLVGSIASASPPSGTDEPAWGGLKRILTGLDKRREVRYCVYRGRNRITADNLAQADCIARVKPLSCWNVNGRSVEKPIDDLLANRYALIHGQWNPFVGAGTEGKFGLDCKMERLVVRDAGRPLPRGTGLYVHTAADAGKFHYAVVTSIDGVQNTTDIGKDNSLSAPIAERPTECEPVLQKRFPPRRHWNYPEQRHHYVRWVAAPRHGNLPTHYYNWSVGVPDVAGKAAQAPGGAKSARPDGIPLELSLHRSGRSYWRTQYRVELNSLVLTPHDFPLSTCWYGYHESQGTLKSFRRGFIHNYTQRRVLSFIEWACSKWPVDRGRVFVTGLRGVPGTGGLHLGLRHPKLFNAVQVGFAVADFKSAIRLWPQWRRMKRYIPDVERIWGKVAWDLKAARASGGGARGSDAAKPRSIWEQMDLTRWVRELPAKTELPLVTITGRIYRQPTRDFFLAMMERGHFIAGSFSVWGGPALSPVSATGNLDRGFPQDVRRSALLPAFRAGIGALKAEPQKGRYAVSFNLGFHWSDPVDSPDRCGITLRYSGYRDRPTTTAVTLRRLREFKVRPGGTYKWEFHPLNESKNKPQGGQVTVGDDGLLVVPALTIGPADGRLMVTGG